MNIRKKEYEEIKKRLEKVEKKAALFDELVGAILGALSRDIEEIAKQKAEEVFFRETV